MVGTKPTDFLSSKALFLHSLQDAIESSMEIDDGIDILW